MGADVLSAAKLSGPQGKELETRCGKVSPADSATKLTLSQKTSNLKSQISVLSCCSHLISTFGFAATDLTPPLVQLCVPFAASVVSSSSDRLIKDSAYSFLVEAYRQIGADVLSAAKLSGPHGKELEAHCNKVSPVDSATSGSC
jgi:hypothetical protein